MGTREMTSKDSGGVRFNIIFLLIVCVNLVTSPCSGDEAAAPPLLPYSSMNSCPDHLISHIIDAISCKSPSVAPPPPPPHDGGDLNPVTDATSDRDPSTATFAGVEVRTSSASRKEEGMHWEILLILVFPVAVRAVLICPRFVGEQVLIVSIVNAITAFLLPTEWKWVPAVCFVSSLLILVVAPRLP